MGKDWIQDQDQVAGWPSTLAWASPPHVVTGIFTSALWLHLWRLNLLIPPKPGSLNSTQACMSAATTQMKHHGWLPCRCPCLPPCVQAPVLPKTRSGKIMRRVLRKVAAGAERATHPTLLETAVLDKIMSTDSGPSSGSMALKSPSRTFTECGSTAHFPRSAARALDSSRLCRSASRRADGTEFSELARHLDRLLVKVAEKVGS
jgi:hypothetical protein